MKRIKQGWSLAKKSWAVLRSNSCLFDFVIYGVIAGVATAVVVIGSGVVLVSHTSIIIPGVALIIVGIYLVTFIGVFFNVALAGAANLAMRGEAVSVHIGLRIARQRIKQIAAWALFAATINVIFNLIRSETGIIGRIIASFFEVAWNLITFLVIPVLALEGLGPVKALKRSSHLFRERWGQQITGTIAIGGVIFLTVILPAVGVGILGIYLLNTISVLGIILIITAGIAIIAALIISNALRGIFGVALYNFAAKDEILGQFTKTELEAAAVRQKS